MPRARTRTLLKHNVIIPEDAVAAMERGDLSARSVCLLSVLSLVAMREPYQVDPTPADAPIPRDRTVRVGVRRLEALSNMAFDTVRKCLSELVECKIVHQIRDDARRKTTVYRIQFPGERWWVPLPEHAVDLLSCRQLSPTSVAVLAFLLARRDLTSNTISIGTKRIRRQTRVHWGTLQLSLIELQAARVLKVVARQGGTGLGRPTYGFDFPPPKPPAILIPAAQLNQKGTRTDLNGNPHTRPSAGISENHVTQTGTRLRPKSVPGTDLIGDPRISTSTKYKKYLSSSRMKSMREGALRPATDPPSRADLITLLTNAGKVIRPTIAGEWVNAVQALADTFGWSAVWEAMAEAAERVKPDAHPRQTIAYARSILESK